MKSPRLIALTAGFTVLGAGVATSANASTDSTTPAPAARCTALSGPSLLAGPDDVTVAGLGADATPLPDTITGGAARAFRGADGTVWTSTDVTPADGRVSEIFRHAPGAAVETVASGESTALTGAGWLDGRFGAGFIDSSVNEGQEDYGSVSVDFADGERIDVGNAFGGEYGVRSVSLAGDRVVIGAVADLTEAFTSVDAAGAEFTDLFDPITDELYNSAPFFQWPIAAVRDGADIARLSWVEGPDTSADSPDRATGTWSLVTADARTGEHELRLELDVPEDAWLIQADYDGRRWVGTFASPPRGDEPPEANLVLDVDVTDAPEVVNATCEPGVVVTIDRIGTSAPPEVGGASDDSVAQPATTAVADDFCEQYVEAPDRYPVQACTSGDAVSVIQDRLDGRGYDVEQDGDFGPLTEAAVRQFQADIAVEVDGLVGLTTWNALMDPLLTPANDVDGNGTTDPWEASPTD